MADVQKPAKRGLVDVHAHFLLPGHTDALTRKVMGEWSPRVALDFMDARGIDMQLLSFTEIDTADEARRLNDHMASLVREHPGRFGMLASVPLASADEALREIGRAGDELGADGFALPTNVEGRYFGDAFFDPIWSELDRRGAGVFVHPTNPAGFDLTSCGRPGPLIEFPMDTARTVVDALYAGVFQRFPGLRMVLAHAGGVLPALFDRLLALGTLPWVPHPATLTRDGIRAQLARLYVDTAIAGGPGPLGAAAAMVGAEHLLFGTDYPAAGIAVIDEQLALLPEGGFAQRAAAVFPAIAPRLALPV
ncbi:amidohydrolase family protein [Actinocorallia sp. A-T 12471]|uniref:amidohydrolase family protein n=1 Tax=Actinocorallia sp. A-T 12471 TaxID=3089813 RepID=UPI0029D23A18|nr:amidohydrolase family protein [Actinocorallia sp. A-T 12471]MDX6740614.1 amidohydrolase family protein [Actinocorallia sp. A-T 12471]